jgi:hypothetical protein
MITSRTRRHHAAARVVSWPRNLLLVACTALLAACGGTANHSANVEPTQEELAAAAAWGANCYKGFERDVIALAGEQSLDCGFLRIDALGGDREKVNRCLHIAVAGNEPFRVGHIDGDGRTLACDVAMRDGNGQLWRLWYDFDIANVHSQGASDGVLIASRCKSLAFKPGSTLPGSFFALEGCEEVPPGVASVPYSPGFRR